jgi:hydrogenase maturation protease
MTTPLRILIAGIGNIFLGDDAFGCEVARRMMGRPLPAGVRVVDFGIRGIDLTYALVDGCDIAILVDAVPRGEASGTIFLIEPDMNTEPDFADGIALIETHNMDPAKVLASVRSQGGQVRRVLLVGCEPTPIDPEMDMQMELSPPVLAAIDGTIEFIELLVQKLMAEETAVIEHARSVLTT